MIEIQVSLHHADKKKKQKLITKMNCIGVTNCLFIICNAFQLYKIAESLYLSIHANAIS